MMLIPNGRLADLDCEKRYSPIDLEPVSICILPEVDLRIVYTANDDIRCEMWWAIEHECMQEAYFSW